MSDNEMSRKKIIRFGNVCAPRPILRYFILS